jgi:hypothetical protein
MPVQQVLLPLFVEVILTFVLLFWLAPLRAHDFSSGVRPEDIALREPNWSKRSMQVAYSYSNQFELPVLFYAAVAFALLTKGVDFLMLVLAWLFVLSRIAHAAIHVGPNRVRWRSPVFALGLLILAGMWLKLFFHVLTGGFA